MPIAGATVRLGGATAITGADGVATVVAPGAGRHALQAAKPASSALFPRTIAVADASRRPRPARSPSPPPRAAAGWARGRARRAERACWSRATSARASSAPARPEPIPGGETVMRMLQRDFEVQTRYGGGFVQSIDGVAGGRQDGRPVDWFYYVNGILADDGAAAHAADAGRPDLVGPPRLGRVGRRARRRRRVPRAVPCPGSTASGCPCGSTARPPRRRPCDEVADAARATSA